MEAFNYFYFFFIIILLIAFIATIFGTPSERALSKFELIEAFPNITIERPVDFLSSPDHSNRIFVVSQTGKIIVINNSTPEPSHSIFMDISNKVLNSGEMGLLGMTFDPNFSSNKQFFVYYNEIQTRTSKIVRYTVDVNNPNKANLTSELLILEQNQPYSNHNGGQIRFGPENLLYISLGDGGSANDPHGNSQDRSTLLGSILRINVTKSTFELPYTVPEDNPFVNNSQGYREEIYAYGLRNVWRFSFDTLTGTLWAGDVGQNTLEEINIIHKGGNYGWNIKEGKNCFNPSTDCDSTNLIDPLYQYTRAGGFSITGGYIYRGTDFLDLNGSYIYGDYITGKIWKLDVDNHGNVDNRLILDTNINISAFGIDNSNELYILGYEGTIYKFSLK